MSQTLLVLNDPPDGTERSYNGLRLAGSLVKQSGEEVRVFLMGDAASCGSRGQTLPRGYYNIESMLKGVIGGDARIGVCGSCMDARGISETDLVDGCRRSTMEELTVWVQWADKVVVF